MKCWSFVHNIAVLHIYAPFPMPSSNLIGFGTWRLEGTIFVRVKRRALLSYSCWSSGLIYVSDVYTVKWVIQYLVIKTSTYCYNFMPLNFTYFWIHLRNFKIFSNITHLKQFSNNITLTILKLAPNCFLLSGKCVMITPSFFTVKQSDCNKLHFFMYATRSCDFTQLYRRKFNLLHSTGIYYIVFIIKVISTTV